MALNFVLQFSTPFLWMQDRPYDEMSEEKETRKIHDTKNGAQVGVYYSIPLLWPQYRIPDEEFS